MSALIGLLLALMISVAARLVGLDRDRAFYPVVLIVIASYYGLFAVLDGSTKTLLIETGLMTIFIGVGVVGFKKNLWWVVTALIAHGLFDAIHGYMVSNAGVPSWWPLFCLAYDLVAAACIAGLILSGQLAARPAARNPA